MKRTLRTSVLEALRALPPEGILQRSAWIQNRVLALPEFARAEAVGCYLALPHEVQTEAVIAACWQAKKRIGVPALRKREGVYDWAWLKPGAALRTGRWSIPEPRNVEWADPAALDLILVPAVAFDRDGGRLGHGGGYFDRLLARCRGFKVGVAFGTQIVEKTPIEPHDVLMNAVATEEHVFRIGKQSTKRKKTAGRVAPPAGG